MNDRYLIPANSKRSMLILGLFTPIDLAIFGVGAVLSLGMLLGLSANTMKDMLIILTPALISIVMILPVPNHHNVWQLTANVYRFFSSRRTYFWKGWCMTGVEETNEGK